MEIIQALQSVASPALDGVALALTNLGSEQAYIVALLVAYLAIDASAARVLGLGLLASFYLNQQLKAAFDTARPYVEHPELLRSEAAYETGPGAAFPSGHAQSAATFWGAVAGLARRRWATAAAVAMIAAIGVTRLYLGVHWPVDVAGGVAIGLAAAAATLWLARAGLRPGATVQLLLWVALPLAAHLLLPTANSGVVAGGMAGFGTAPMLFRHRPSGGVARRAALAAAGLVAVFAWLLATSVLLPEAVKDHALVAPARYWILAWLGLVAVPWAAVRVGLVDRPRGR